MQCILRDPLDTMNARVWEMRIVILNFSFFPGLHKDYEADEAAELMPSCFPLLIFDCVFMKLKNCFMPNSKEEKEKEEYWNHL